jgi:hypothetical protein
MDTNPDTSKATPYSSDAGWSKIIKAAENYLPRLPSALLHGCRTKAPECVRAPLSPSKFWLQYEESREWAMLGSNQRPLPCEGSALPLS